MSNSILDSLCQPDNTTTDGEINEESYLPEKCKMCCNAIICKILPSIIGFSSYGIKISITTCPYELEMKVKNG